ncbi:nucleoside monophosphate kinase [archaeon]|jgi:adenylate kinase|nr:nucleoside monophosphate kinase [archaeon]
MKLVFIGKQGSGKGTQARIISQKLNICHVSTGDLLRHVKGKLGKKIHSLIDEGNMVGDELMLEVLMERLRKEDCKNGFILDGYPRDLVQARILEKEIGVDLIVEIYIEDKIVVDRLTNRLNCGNCGAIFNLKTNPPHKEGICDKCSDELFVREDDNEAAILQRLKLYKKKTQPVINFFGKKVIRVDGSKNVEEVAKEIEEKLKL